MPAPSTLLVFAPAAGALGGWLRSRREFARAQRYVTGCIYLGLAAVAAVAGGERRGR